MEEKIKSKIEELEKEIMRLGEIEIANEKEHLDRCKKIDINSAIIDVLKEILE